MEMTSNATGRLKRLLLWAGLILGIGLAYAVFVRLSGLSIPCPVHALTGLLCPGCGVTSMCLALLRLDFAAAFRWNPGLMALSPFLGALIALLIARYIRTGSWRPGRWQTACLWAMLGLLLVWGVVRNVMGI